MASKFTNLLNKLSTDPTTLAQYKQDPEKVMDAEGLTPAEKTLLLSGDAKLILAAFYNDPANRTGNAPTLAQQYQAVPYVSIVHP